MEIGKVPENVLKRSILKQIKTKRPEVLVGADVGEDCAIIGLQPDEVMVLSTDPITGTTKEMGRWAVMISANDIASSGAEVIGVLVCALLPPRIREIKIREMMQEATPAVRTVSRLPKVLYWYAHYFRRVFGK